MGMRFSVELSCLLKARRHHPVQLELPAERLFDQRAVRRHVVADRRLVFARLVRLEVIHFHEQAGHVKLLRPRSVPKVTVLEVLERRHHLALLVDLGLVVVEHHPQKGEPAKRLGLPPHDGRHRHRKALREAELVRTGGHREKPGAVRKLKLAVAEKLVAHSLLTRLLDHVGTGRGHPVELRGVEVHPVERALHRMIDAIDGKCFGAELRDAWRGLRRRCLLARRRRLHRRWISFAAEGESHGTGERSPEPNQTATSNHGDSIDRFTATA